MVLVLTPVKKTMQTLWRALGEKENRKNIKTISEFSTCRSVISSFSGSSSTGSWIWSSYRSTRCRRSALNMNTIIFIKPKNIFASVLQVFFAFQIAMEIESQRIYNLNCVPLNKRDKVETRKIWSSEIIWFVWCLNYSALSVYPRVSHQLQPRGRLSNGVSKYKESAKL